MEELLGPNDGVRLLSDKEATMLMAFATKPVLGQYVHSILLWLEELEVDSLPDENEAANILLRFIDEGLVRQQREPSEVENGITPKYFVLADKTRADKLLRHKRHHLLDFAKLLDV
jgi:hypothetical protein